MNPEDFPARLHHVVPSWVKAGSTYHIRLRAITTPDSTLTQPSIARPLIDSAAFYHAQARWHCRLLLVMPDHVHALLAFPQEAGMSRVVGEWKKYHAVKLGIHWQPNYFDHRIRNDASLDEKHHYIMRNPVVKGLCGRVEDWPWVWSPAHG
jgi:REP element-mobilizing transposase RayT